MSSVFDSELKTIAEKQKKVNESAKESQDVKDGILTEEEQLKEPSYVLFNSMMDSITKIMQKKEVTESIENIFNILASQGVAANKAAAIKELINLMIIVMTTSSYEAILCYDDMLKGELTTHFDNIVKYFNEVKLEVNAHNGTLSVFKKHLSEIDNKLKMDEMRKQTDQ